MTKAPALNPGPLSKAGDSRHLLPKVDASKPKHDSVATTPPASGAWRRSPPQRETGVPPVSKTLGEAGFKFHWERTVAKCRLGAATKAVAGWLGHHSNSQGFSARPGIRTLAFETELSERTVRRSLDQMRELGLLVRVVKGSTAGNRKWADEYVLNIPDDLSDRVQVAEGPTERRSGEGKGGMANHVRWHQRRDKLDPACIHCTESQRGLDEASEGMREPSREDSAQIRPVAKRSPTTGPPRRTNKAVPTRIYLKIPLVFARPHERVRGGVIFPASLTSLKPSGRNAYSRVKTSPRRMRPGWSMRSATTT